MPKEQDPLTASKWVQSADIHTQPRSSCPTIRTQSGQVKIVKMPQSEVQEKSAKAEITGTRDRNLESKKSRDTGFSKRWLTAVSFFLAVFPLSFFDHFSHFRAFVSLFGMQLLPVMAPRHKLLSYCTQARAAVPGDPTSPTRSSQNYTKI